MAQVVACDIHPLNNLIALQYLKRTLKHEQADIDAWYHHWVIEGFKAIEWMTDTKPLLALADIYAVSPANKEAAANPALSAKNPGMLSSHVSDGLFINTEFWVANGEDLEQKFNAWLAK